MITIGLGPQEVAYVKEMARKAEIGGASNIRQGEERADNLTVDQIVGQLGEYALSIYLFGTPERYYVQRLSCDINPRLGDAGQDILGLNVDVKTSLMRNDMSAEKYHLIVRPREMHEHWVYIHALVKPIGKGQGAFVLLTGWAASADFPEVETEGTFAGAHVLPVPQLSPLLPLKWKWRPQ